MNVSLTPELEKRIAEKVESGLYASASDVIRESLRLLFEAEEQRGGVSSSCAPTSGEVWISSIGGKPLPGNAR